MMETEEDKPSTGASFPRDITEGHAQANEEAALLGHKES